MNKLSNVDLLAYLADLMAANENGTLIPRQEFQKILGLTKVF